MASRVLSEMSRVTGRLSCRLFAALAPVRQEQLHCLSRSSRSLHDAAAGSLAKWSLGTASQCSTCLVVGNSGLQRSWFSSSASLQCDEREPGTISDEERAVEHGDSSGDFSQADASNEFVETNDSSKVPEKTEGTDKKTELSVDDLVKLVAEREELLKLKHKEIETMKDKVLRSYAETENVIDRTKREAENSKKFAIQNFAKNLLDVADNLGRASSIVKEKFSKLDSSKDTAGAVPVLKTLLEGVEMTDKQLAEVFRKFGVEKFDPVNEHFDPHRHHAVFQIPDASKPPGTVAAVLKAGYMLYDRVIRPAEVGVTAALDETDSSSEA